MFGIQIIDEIGYGFEISKFNDAGVVVAARERFPYFSGGLADLEETAHMARSMAQ